MEQGGAGVRSVLTWAICTDPSQGSPPSVPSHLHFPAGSYSLCTPFTWCFQGITWDAPLSPMSSARPAQHSREREREGHSASLEWPVPAVPHSEPGPWSRDIGRTKPLFLSQCDYHGHTHPSEYESRTQKVLQGLLNPG